MINSVAFPAMKRIKLLVFAVTICCIVWYSIRYAADHEHPFPFFSHGGMKAAYAIAGYDFYRPGKIYSLPPILAEVSGITLINDGALACVQDELGIVFIYNTGSRHIEHQIPFGEAGDYEDIALAGNALYILRSDGLLFEIENYKKQDAPVNQYALHLPSSNNEGLCYDAPHQRLLIAAKSKSRDNKQIRTVYGFDLIAKRLMPEPVLEIDVSVLAGFADQMNVPLPQKEKKDGSVKTMLKFMPSAIAIHPHSRNRYVLSAADNSLAVFDKGNNLLTFCLLDSNLFNKPEGIAFTANGDMLVSNEGGQKAATVVMLKYKHDK